MRRETSIDPDWFEALYRDHGDPWQFETSPYERAKYDHTLASLPAARVGHVLEVGCANGVLTERLAARCGHVLGVDVSSTALASAALRCARLENVTIALHRLPGEAPPGPFDLILLSEVLYYWDTADIGRMAEYARETIPSGGHLLLVHWTGDTDYPKSGDAAVDELRHGLARDVEPVLTERRENYRLDLWRRT